MTLSPEWHVYSEAWVTFVVGHVSIENVRQRIANYTVHTLAKHERECNGNPEQRAANNAEHNLHQKAQCIDTSQQTSSEKRQSRHHEENQHGTLRPDCAVRYRALFLVSMKPTQSVRMQLHLDQCHKLGRRRQSLFFSFVGF